MRRVYGITVAAALLATVGSTLSVYPHQLAYFNELAGGPENGHRHLLHSNLDWGQGLLLFKEWVDSSASVGDDAVISVLYSEAISPDVFGFRDGYADLLAGWLFPDRDQSGLPRRMLRPRFVAVGINTIMEREEFRRQLDGWRPIQVVGYTLYVFSSVESTDSLPGHL